MNVSVKGYICVFLMCISCQDTKEIVETPADEFSKNIRTTEARSPEDERAGFMLPEGFKIELFASEPDIGKPLNMAFDEKGRMWLTQSNEYPFPNEAGKDRITILEDTNNDGRADRFIEFADSLNIPIGILPVNGGAIAYSIPNVYFLKDNNNDDKADERVVLLSGFEYSDTHGMVNNFIRGLDGWIHADHGYKNKSRVVGTGKMDTVYMNSGNTFRFRPDGSEVELTTTGRVNPFGLTYDEYGNLYGVDCHSSPIYQLIRGGDYPHFGKVPTGIGYAPFMMRHEYGSTALAGLELYVAPDFPEEFQNNFYYGDVVLSRVLRSSMQMEGTTPVPSQETDFIISDDPWFRPVDVKLGPDGALYIADFYNRIIGHYEVPLDHPGRDRERGRIWRVTYEGDQGGSDFRSTDWSDASLEELINGLGDKNLVVRMIVSEQIVSKYGQAASDKLKRLVTDRESSSEQVRHGLWLLYRLNDLEDSMLRDILESSDEISQVHALRIMFELKTLSEESLALVREMVHDSNPHIRRAAVMVLSNYPDFINATTLINLLPSADQGDTHLVYTIRQSLRDLLRSPSVLKDVLVSEEAENNSGLLADVLIGVEQPAAAAFLLDHLENHEEPVERVIRYTKHVARYIPMSDFNRVIDISRKVANDSLDLEYTLFSSLQEGVGQRGESMPVNGQRWAEHLAGEFLSTYPGNWVPLPLKDVSYQTNPWIIFSEGEEHYLSTLREGIYTGIIHSPVFTVPDQMEFKLTGNKREPLLNEEPAPSRLKVQLLSHENNELLAETHVLRPSEIRKVQWDLNKFQGQRAYLSIEDGSAIKGEYVGIGLKDGPIGPLPPDLHQLSRRQLFGCGVASEYRMRSLVPDLKQIIESRTADILVRGEALQALTSIQPEEGMRLAGKLIEDDRTPDLLRVKVIDILQEVSSRESQVLLAKAAPKMNFVGKTDIAWSLSHTVSGIDLLFESVNQLVVPPAILLDEKVNKKLEETMTAAQRTTLKSLTEGVKPPQEELQLLIESRVAAFQPASHQISDGQRVYNQNCAACHKIKDQGGNIGPQLDGIGNWGAQALMEKILAPNRSISQAFINYSITLKDGGMRNGLFRREEGDLLVFASTAGEEFSIPKASIAERKAVPFTLMPDQFSKTIPEEDFYALINYLLSQK